MFGKDLNIYNVSNFQITLLYIFVAVSFIYIVYKYRNKYFELFILLVYYAGLVGYIGPNVQNVYKIILISVVIFWTIKTKSFQINKGNSLVIISFVLFSVAFLFTSYINKDYLLIIFSQYSRYLMLFLLFLIFYHYRENKNVFLKLDRLFIDILIIQIIVSIIKLLIMGPKESLVGTITAQGGAAATSLPLLAIIFIWLRKSGNLKKEDWILIFGMFFIGFAGYKRAIWFIGPLLIGSLILFMGKRSFSPKVIIISILLVPLVFYFGVRLNPTLNKEHLIWGSFDLEFVLNYAEEYQFGRKESNAQGEGRGGAALLLYNKFFDSELTVKDWFGTGLKNIFAIDYEDFEKENYGINHKGSATGFVQTWISHGYIGIFFLLLFMITITLNTENRKLRYILYGFLFWEYFFYTGIIFRYPTLFLLLIFIILFQGKNTSILINDLNKDEN